MVNENKTALVMYCRIKNFELLQKRRFRVVESSAGQKTPKIVKKERVKRKFAFAVVSLSESELPLHWLCIPKN